MEFLFKLATILSGSALVQPAPPPPVANPAYVYSGTCDGSAAARLSDDFLVDANDEDNLLRVYRIEGGQHIVHASLLLDDHLNAGGAEVDIEGAAAATGRIYWISSHGLNRRARPRPERHRFFATIWDGQRLQAFGHRRDDLMTTALAAGGPQGLGLLEASTLAPEAGGINIEGLATGADGALLIGFRSPLVGSEGTRKRAILLPLRNPSELVQANIAPTFGTPILLDLGGRGIRSIERLDDGTYLIIAGAVEDSGNFAIFRWSGNATDDPRLVAADLQGISPEALVPLNATDFLLLSDDGTDACKEAPPSDRSFRGRILHIPAAR